MPISPIGCHINSCVRESHEACGRICVEMEHRTLISPQNWIRSDVRLAGISILVVITSFYLGHHTTAPETSLQSQLAMWTSCKGRCIVSHSDKRASFLGYRPSPWTPYVSEWGLSHSRGSLSKVRSNFECSSNDSLESVWRDSVSFPR
jgi:hypothetical protein